MADDSNITKNPTTYVTGDLVVSGSLNVANGELVVHPTSTTNTTNTTNTLAASTLISGHHWYQSNVTVPVYLQVKCRRCKRDFFHTKTAGYTDTMSDPTISTLTFPNYTTITSSSSSSIPLSGPSFVPVGVPPSACTWCKGHTCPECAMAYYQRAYENDNLAVRLLSECGYRSRGNPLEGLSSEEMRAMLSYTQACESCLEECLDDG